MKNKVIAYINEKQLIHKGDRVLVALSGGPDSVCMLNILMDIRKEYNMEVGAAHINHMVRGEEADGDQEYVKTLCEKFNIPCFIKRIDINKIAKEKGISSEMAGREERYGFFNEILQKHSYNKIALAHNANDQAETILMRIMRGTGLEGLVGIRAKRDNIYIRPILDIGRFDIEKYCEENNLNPRIDKTNLENVYSRNKVRLEMIPYIKDNFNPEIINTLNRLGILMGKDEDFINEFVKKGIDDYCIFANDLSISSKLFQEHESILTRTLKNSLTIFSKKHFDFEMKHIYDIITLQKGKTGIRLSLPHGLEAINVYGDIKIKPALSKEKYSKENDVILRKEEVLIHKMTFNKYNVEFNVLDNQGDIKFWENSHEKYFDYDKIQNYISIRTRINGDRMKPLGMKGNKKLKDLFIDLKVPKEDREFIPIVCFDKEIAWAVGVRTSEDFRISKNTKKILKVKFTGKE